MPLKRDEQGNLVIVAGASNRDSDWIKYVKNARKKDLQAHTDAEKMEKERRKDDQSRDDSG